MGKILSTVNPNNFSFFVSWIFLTVSTQWNNGNVFLNLFHKKLTINEMRESATLIFKHPVAKYCIISQLSQHSWQMGKLGRED